MLHPGRRALQVSPRGKKGITVVIEVDSNNDGEVDDTIETTWEEIAAL